MCIDPRAAFRVRAHSSNKKLQIQIFKYRFLELHSYEVAPTSGDPSSFCLLKAQRCHFFCCHSATGHLFNSFLLSSSPESSLMSFSRCSHPSKSKRVQIIKIGSIFRSISSSSFCLPSFNSVQVLTDVYRQMK